MEKQHFNIEKLHEKSSLHAENVIRQKIENLKKSLESQERRLEATENKSQKAAIEAQKRNSENQLAELTSRLNKMERESGAGHA